MSPHLDRFELANTVYREGGSLLGILEYGLKAEDLPESDTELRDLWRDLELAWHTFNQAADRVSDLLPEPEYF